MAKTIMLHQDSPEKPAYGESCNGCGACCAIEPCPVAHLFLLQFRGRCRALSWDESSMRYLCGMVTSPHRYSWLVPERWSRQAGKLLAGRIACGSGCDSAAEME